MKPNIWQVLVIRPNGPVMLVCEREFWLSPCLYLTIKDTYQERDINSGGNKETRRLARSLLVIPKVKGVKLSGNTIFINISEDITNHQSKRIGENAVEIVKGFLIYN